MGFLKRIAGIFGLARDDAHDAGDEDNGGGGLSRREGAEAAAEAVKGGGVSAAVGVDRAPAGPLVARSSFGDGGVQGLRWYSKRLRIDEDGDVGDEFLDEVYSESSQSAGGKIFAKFAIKYNARPVVVRKQAICDGNVRQNVEFRGKLLWV